MWLNFLRVSSHAALRGAAAMLSLAGPRTSGHNAACNGHLWLCYTTGTAAGVGHQPRCAMPKGLADHTSPTVSISAVQAVRKGWDAAAIIS